MCHPWRGKRIALMWQRHCRRKLQACTCPDRRSVECRGKNLRPLGCEHAQKQPRVLWKQNKMCYPELKLNWFLKLLFSPWNWDWKWRSMAWFVADCISVQQDLKWKYTRRVVSKSRVPGSSMSEHPFSSFKYPWNQSPWSLLLRSYLWIIFTFFCSQHFA